MHDNLISISDAAKELGYLKQSLFKVINRLKMEKLLIKSSDARGQSIAYISIVDYEILRDNRAATQSIEEESAVDLNIGGFFYIIQLEPKLDPNRLKFGFAVSVDERVRKHKTAAPFSLVLATYPCKLLWEKTAIECVAFGSEKLHTEVFRVHDIEKTLSQAEAFFKLMPPPYSQST